MTLYYTLPIAEGLGKYILNAATQQTDSQKIGTGVYILTNICPNMFLSPLLATPYEKGPYLSINNNSLSSFS